MKKVKMIGDYEKGTEILFIGSPELNQDELHRYLSFYSFLELLPKKLRKYMEPSSQFTCVRNSKGDTIVCVGYHCYCPFYLKKKKLKMLEEYFEEFSFS